MQQTAYYKNWLYKTATNLAIDYLRRHKLIGYVPLQDNELPEPMVEEEADRIHDRLWLQEAVAQLSPKQQQCLVEMYYEGFKQKEIAVALGITELSVSAYVSKGITELRKKYYLVTADIRSMEMGAIYLKRELKYKYKDLCTYKDSSTYPCYEVELEFAREHGFSPEMAEYFARYSFGEEDAAEFMRIFTSNSDEMIEEYQIQESFTFMNGTREFNEETLSEADRALWYAHPQRRRLMRQLAHETAGGIALPSGARWSKQRHNIGIPIEDQKGISQWSHSYTLTMEEYRQRFPIPKPPVQLPLFDGE